MSNAEKKDIWTTLIDFLDAISDFYSTAFMLVLPSRFTSEEEGYPPFVISWVEKALRLQDEENKNDGSSSTLSVLLSPLGLTYTRTFLLIPMLLFLAWDWSILSIVVFMVFGIVSVLDEAVYKLQAPTKQQSSQPEQKDTTSTAAAKSSSDTGRTDHVDSFEVITTGSPVSVTSWVQLYRNYRHFPGLVDSVSARAFLIPCWISLLHFVPRSRFLKPFQYLILVVLIYVEFATGCIHFRAFFTSGGVPASPQTTTTTLQQQGGGGGSLGGHDSLSQTHPTMKVKQILEMVGTALFILPGIRYFGLLLLALAVPLAYEEIRRKVKSRVIYVHGNSSSKVFDHRTIRFWIQAKAMGTKLIVGMPGEKNADMVMNACAISCVDQVIAEAPKKADLIFLERQGVHLVVLTPEQLTPRAPAVTDEVIAAHRCVVIREDGVAQPVEPKGSQHTE